ncbi:MAG TPA: serpin family protein [Polyangiales bacterium]|nr:serpin family protein [Polyangiales bacterium]
MRVSIALLLCLAGACTGTRTGNPGHNEVPAGVVLAKSELARDEQPELPSDKAKTFGADNRGFALALYRELAKEPGNLFFSPYSISSALAMTYAGAKGETASEIATALHFRLPQSELHPAFNATDLSLAKRKAELIESSGREPTKGQGFQLHVVNQAWGQKGYEFLDGYLDVLAASYGAGMFLIDFGQPEAARKTINGWVEDQTAQRIEELLPEDSIDEDVRLLLTNAIYFKASWLKEFEPSNTKPAMFQTATGARSVDMMHAVLDTTYAEVSGYRAVALPYISPSVRMIAVLPPEGKFADAAAELDVAIVDGLLEKLSRAFVTLSLPKWRFESESKLKGPLRQLGMNAAFDPSAADLSGMDGKPGMLYIDEVYHKAFVSVDEQGTEAAAATAVVASRVSAPPPVTLSFDRPFLFLIYDEPTGHILFLGHLSEPK